jgi:hypothetical protein
MNCLISRFTGRGEQVCVIKADTFTVCAIAVVEHCQAHRLTPLFFSWSAGERPFRKLVVQDAASDLALLSRSRRRPEDHGTPDLVTQFADVAVGEYLT